MRARPARWTRPSRSCSTSTAMAEGHGFFQVGSTAVAPDNSLLAFTEDTVGRRQYTLRFKNLATGELLPDAHRERRARRRLGRRQPQRPLPREGPGDAARAGACAATCSAPTRRTDALVYEQDDDSFYTGVGTTKDERYIMIFSRSTVSTEVRYARRGGPRARVPRLPAARARPRVLRRPPRRALDHPHQLAGAELPPDGSDRRRGGRPREVARAGAAPRRRLRRRLRRVQRTSSPSRSAPARCARSASGRWGGGKDFYIASDEPAYTTSLGMNAELDTQIVRYEYTSLTTPMTVYDYDIQTGERQLHEAHAGARRLRPRELPHRAPVGAGARRREGAGVARLPQRVHARTAPRRCCSTATAPTARPWTRRSRSRACRCSTAASSTRSRTSAAARRWAGAGTRTAGC